VNITGIGAITLKAISDLTGAIAWIKFAEPEEVL